MYGFKNCVNNKLWIEVDFDPKEPEGFSWVMIAFCILPWVLVTQVLHV